MFKSIEDLVTGQAGGSSRPIGRWLRNGVTIAAIAVVSFGLEWTFDLYQLVDVFIEDNEAYHSQPVVITGLMTLVAFLVYRTIDLRREAERRRGAEAAALKLAFHDPLTRLGNRRKLEQELASLPHGKPHAVLMLDLDEFKPINDIFGHAAGDAVLGEAARRLETVCGPEALVCRFGGDEFAVLTGPIGGESEAELLARRIAAGFEKPFIVGAADSRVGTSIGVAMYFPGQMAPADAIRRADLALYRAKSEPYNCYRVFEQTMDDELRRRTLMERKLRKAIELGAVRPFYQPLVDLKESEIIGFEALARWTDPELGNVPPTEFIALAEESGLITELSDHLLRTACRDAARWPQHLKLAFNLSPKQLKDKLIGLRILSILGETGLSPRRLEIEVTESSLVEDKDVARELLTGLRNAGVRIAIDDFGTGYSSLYHLREFKFDNLKIDRSFIMSMDTGRDSEVIVKTILGLSHGLGLVATAEGIEREDQLSSLLASGCEQGQGYLFGKAVPASEVLDLIATAEREAAVA